MVDMTKSQLDKKKAELKAIEQKIAITTDETALKNLHTKAEKIRAKLQTFYDELDIIKAELDQDYQRIMELQARAAKVKRVTNVVTGWQALSEEYNQVAVQLNGSSSNSETKAKIGAAIASFQRDLDSGTVLDAANKIDELESHLAALRDEFYKFKAEQLPAFIVASDS